MKSDSLPPAYSDIKQPLVANEKEERMLISTPSRRVRPFVVGVMAIGVLYLLWNATLSYCLPTAGMQALVSTTSSQVAAQELVPLEAHIMSKCPDAQDCLKMLVLPAMMRVVDKVNFTLSYIGTPTANDGVECMHGPEECMGNIIELCAASLYPDPKIYLGFTMCLMRDYKEIPAQSLVEDCALEHGIDFASLNECAVRDDGGFGVGLLRDSVTRSTKAGVTKSCTVRLNEEIYCIRDGRQWKDCPNGPGVNDLVIAVEKLYRS